MNKIKYIKQKNKSDCVIASLAMATGQTYDAVLNDLKEYWQWEGESSGVDDECALQYLSELGYVVNKFAHDYVPSEHLRDEWPPEPFAPVHLCSVFNEGMHSVVMDDKGRIYDPDDSSKKKLSDFHRVYDVWGVYKLDRDIK